MLFVGFYAMSFCKLCFFNIVSSTTAANANPESLCHRPPDCYHHSHITYLVFCITPQWTVPCTRLSVKNKNSIDPKQHNSSFVNIRLKEQVFRDKTDDVETMSRALSQDSLPFTRSNNTCTCFDLMSLK